jgi:hypothetical protein
MWVEDPGSKSGLAGGSLMVVDWIRKQPQRGEIFIENNDWAQNRPRWLLNRVMVWIRPEGIAMIESKKRGRRNRICGFVLTRKGFTF